MKITNVFTALIIILLIMGVSISQTINLNQILSGNQGALINANYTTNQSLLQTSENIIISKVGMPYYNNYIIYSHERNFNYTGSRESQLYFNYAVPYETNNSTTTGIIPSIYGYAKMQIVVSFINNTPIFYFGPSKNYYLKTTALDAFNISKSYNLSTNKVVKVFLSYAYNNASNFGGYTLVWYVLGDNINQVIKYNKTFTYLHGIYTGTQNNTILGENDYQIYGPISPPPIQLLGNFSIIRNTTNPGMYVRKQYSNITYNASQATTSIIAPYASSNMQYTLIVYVLIFSLVGVYIIKKLVV